MRYLKFRDGFYCKLSDFAQLLHLSFALAQAYQMFTLY